MKLIDALRTTKAIVLGDRDYGKVTRAAERQRLQDATEAAFRDPSNRDRSRTDIEKRLQSLRDFQPADLKVEARNHLQRRGREVETVLSAARARTQRLRLPEEPPITLSSAEALSDLGTQAVIRTLKAIDRRMQRSETKAEFLTMAPAAALEAVSAEVARIAAIDAELALTFPDRPVADTFASEHAKDAAFVSWKNEGARREGLRDERAGLMTRVAVASDTLLSRKPNLEGLTAEAMLKLQGEYARIPEQLATTVAPVIADRLKEADEIAAAAAELEAEWSGGAGGLGVAMVLRTIAHVGEPLQPAAEPFLDSTAQAAKLAGAIVEATDPAKVLDRAIDARLDARESA